MRYHIHSATFVYADGRKNTIEFNDVPNIVDDIESYKNRLPTEATIHLTYTEIKPEDERPKNLHCYCPEPHIG